MKKIALGISAATLMIAGAAFAAHHEGRPNPDTDGDGVTTRAEMQAHATAMFAKLDTNSDGKLDQADRDARHEAMRTMMFDKLDTDSNGSISRDEFMAFEGPRHGGHGMGEAGKEGDGKRHRWGMRGHHGGKMMMMMADADGDGAVTSAEFMASAEKRFAAIDTDSDGKVTKEERDAHHKEMRGKWRERRDN